MDTSQPYMSPACLIHPRVIALRSPKLRHYHHDHHSHSQFSKRTFRFPLSTVTMPRESKTMKPNNLRFLFLLLSSTTLVFLLFLLFRPQQFPNPTAPPPELAVATTYPTATGVQHLVFGIAAASKSFHSRCQYLQAWSNNSYSLPLGFVFLDKIDNSTISFYSHLLPFHLRQSSDTSHLPFTFSGRGFASAVRVARIVKDLLKELTFEGIDIETVRWVVLGDDDTVFFPENLAAVLGKYDWREWWYVGGSSEMVEQNALDWFDMAFGGGGFALSLPLAVALAEVLDGCLMRYGHLYGGDGRIFSCVSELGVELTHEQGFHQVDLRGNIFGLLAAHPLSPLSSLHHLDSIEPIFPNLPRAAGLNRLFEAAKADQARILQQTVCYDRLMPSTVSVSWGYAVQVFDGSLLLPEVLKKQETFVPWRRNRNRWLYKYMFNTREFPKDPCKQPVIFYFESVRQGVDGIWSTYNIHSARNCSSNISTIDNLKQIKVLSQKLDLGKGQALRRHCCDILPSLSTETMTINIRKCEVRELIAPKH